MSEDRKRASLSSRTKPGMPNSQQRLLTNAGIDFTAVIVATRASFVEQLAAFGQM